MRTYTNTAKRGNNVGRLIVILHNIRSVYNVGSIFRTCDGAGVKKIYLIGATPTPLDRFENFRKDFEKVSLGAEKTMEWEYSKSFLAVYEKLKKTAGGQIEILAVEQDKNSISYFKYKKGKKNVALIFGEETKGLPKTILSKADKILEIPMWGKKESLNVSVAVGVVAYSFAND